MARWLESGAASVSAAGAEITCTDNTDFSTVKGGDLVMLAGQLWQAASGSKPDADGQSVLSLHSAWPYDAVEEGSLYVIRTTHELHRLATEIPNLAQITKALLASLEFVLTSDQETIAIPIGTDPVTGEPRTITVTPWQYILDSLSDLTDSITSAQQSAAQAEAARDTAVAAVDDAESSVQQLTGTIEQAQTALAGLQSANNTATASATQAAASAITAGEKEAAAATAADRAEAAQRGAETAQSQAEAVVYEGEASSTPGQGKTPIALAGGVLDMGWLDLLSLRLTDLQHPFIHLFAPGRLSVTDSVSVTARRDSPATYIDRVGRVMTAATNALREQAKGWLLEPAGVNLCTKSEGFSADDEGWSVLYGGSASAISALAPDGETYWTQFQPGAMSNARRLQYSLTPNEDGPLVASWFVMRDPGATQPTSTLSYSVSADDGTGGGSRIYLDWASGELEVDNAAAPRLLRCSSQRIASDTYRVEIAVQVLATDNSVSFGYTGNGKTLGAQRGRMWGMQIEQGRHASSYMPKTDEKSGTRAADVVTVSGAVSPDMTKVSIAVSYAQGGPGLIYSGLDAQGGAVIECGSTQDGLRWSLHSGDGSSMNVDLETDENSVVHSLSLPAGASYASVSARTADAASNQHSTPKLYAPIAQWRIAPTTPLTIRNLRIFDIVVTQAEAHLIL
ncbi:phage head spike fiber domain-containing protein [Ferrimonas balearica]|uniref:phage head spike fiber domain-containing protein n=1 Tax=Ferrimonas balearica TaxID=44012 RepID=UPI001C95A3BE|nr:hypothetical protein [Ferrimonas balearica]MBY6223550.1 hypothetical protein [Ferrimonas balearica]